LSEGEKKKENEFLFLRMFLLQSGSNIDLKETLNFFFLQDFPSPPPLLHSVDLTTQNKCRVMNLKGAVIAKDFDRFLVFLLLCPRPKKPVNNFVVAAVTKY